MMISFYSDREEPYGCFSNFSRHGFTADGFRWKTSEHYFHAQKFVGTEGFDWVRESPAPKIAAGRGRDRRFPLRQDWDQVKDDVMRRAVRVKFAAHADIREILLSTGDAKIIEYAPGDYYWGCGKDGTGKNRLGEILREVRDEFRTP